MSVWKKIAFTIVANIAALYLLILHPWLSLAIVYILVVFAISRKFGKRSHPNAPIRSDD